MSATVSRQAFRPGRSLHAVHAILYSCPTSCLNFTPSAGERFFNRIFGYLVGFGLGFYYNYLLQVRGRKSGKLYSTPIDLLELNGKRFLVAPRGRTQWARNAEAAGEITLKRRSFRQNFRLRDSFRRREAGCTEVLS